MKLKLFSHFVKRLDGDNGQFVLIYQILNFECPLVTRACLCEYVGDCVFVCARARMSLIVRIFVFKKEFIFHFQIK